jgi:cytochrome c-type biogenesis protein CcmH
VKTILWRLAVAMMCSARLLAQSPADTAGDVALERRFNAFVLQVRCLVCQNESLAESRAELAVDLRREIRKQMREGKSDEEIRLFLTDRYGDFVLYRPPLRRSTYLLWFGPFILLAAGCGVIYRMVTRPEPSLSRTSSPAQRKRAQQLLRGGER